MAAGHAAEGIKLLEDVCKRMGDASGCGPAARALISGDAARDGDAGPGVDSPFGRAVEDWEQGCRLGDGKCCWELGRLAMTGKGVPKDQTAAIARFDQACGFRETEGCVDGGLLREREKTDLPAAMKQWQTGCELGNGRGCTKYGLALRKGLIAEPDAAAGLASLEEGCAKGFAGGCGLAALMWEKGDGVPVDPARRQLMLIAGARLRDPIAVGNLVLGYRAGTMDVATVRPVLDAVATAADADCSESDPTACLVAGIVIDDAGVDSAGAGRRYGVACTHGAQEACGRLAALIRAGRVDGSAYGPPARLEEAGCKGHWAPACLAWGLTASTGTEIGGRDAAAAQVALDAACRAGLEEACAAASKL